MQEKQENREKRKKRTLQKRKKQRYENKENLQSKIKGERKKKNIYLVIYNEEKQNGKYLFSNI